MPLSRAWLSFFRRLHSPPTMIAPKTPSNRTAASSFRPAPASMWKAALHPEVRVPMREIALAPTKAFDGALQENEPVRVYDCSGPWGDPAFEGSVEEGLPADARSMDSRPWRRAGVRRPRGKAAGQRLPLLPARRIRQRRRAQSPRRIPRPARQTPPAASLHAAAIP